MKIINSIFKAYDIRGVYPTQVNEKVAYLLGRAYADFLKPKKVIVGRDVRAQSATMEKELIRGLLEQGVDVCQIGQITTDMLFFAVGHFGFDGGIAVSASHNAPEYGGFKFVRKQAIPVTGNSGLLDVKAIIQKGKFRKVYKKGKLTSLDIFADYKKFVLSFVKLAKIKPFKVVFNTLNGAMGPVIEQVVKDLPLQMIWIDKKPDPKLRKGEPNPLLPQRRADTIAIIKTHQADFGVSWDGDGDRCFFFDEKGEFVPAPFVTAILMEYIAKEKPGAKVIIDLRAIYPIVQMAQKYGIKLSLVKSGRTFMQQQLRKQNAFMAAEMTAHYFFRDNFYSDNGIIPFLMVLKLLSDKNQKLSKLLADLRKKFFMIDEIKIASPNGEKIISALKAKYIDGQQNDTDGLTVEYPNWRFNLRSSNTEPVLKLNIESTDKTLLSKKQKEIIEISKKMSK